MGNEKWEPPVSHFPFLISHFSIKRRYRAIPFDKSFHFINHVWRTDSDSSPLVEVFDIQVQNAL